MYIYLVLYLFNITIIIYLIRPQSYYTINSNFHISFQDD